MKESNSDGHYELIVCPECHSIEKAFVEHSFPWNTYIHDCTSCGYTIMESDWQEPDEKDLNFAKENEYKPRKIDMLVYRILQAIFIILIIYIVCVSIVCRKPTNKIDGIRQTSLPKTDKQD